MADSCSLTATRGSRFRVDSDVLASSATDLGGVDRLSEGQKQIARRCAMLSVECEIMESAAVVAVGGRAASISRGHIVLFRGLGNHVDLRGLLGGAEGDSNRGAFGDGSIGRITGRS